MDIKNAFTSQILNPTCYAMYVRSIAGHLPSEGRVGEVKGEGRIDFFEGREGKGEEKIGFFEGREGKEKERLVQKIQNFKIVHFHAKIGHFGGIFAKIFMLRMFVGKHSL